MNLRKIALLINIGLICLIIWAATDIVLTWRNQKQEEAHKKADSPKASSPTKILPNRPKTLRDFQPIIAKNIFKTVKSESAPGSTRQKDEKEIEATSLNLNLKGTVLGENEPSFAIIGDGKNKEDLYYMKEFVEGAQIVKILSDRVILNVNGKEEALIMSDESKPSPIVNRPLPRGIPERRAVRRVPPRVRTPFTPRGASPSLEGLSEESDQDKGEAEEATKDDAEKEEVEKSETQKAVKSEQ